MNGMNTLNDLDHDFSLSITFFGESNLGSKLASKLE